LCINVLVVVAVLLLFYIYIEQKKSNKKEITYNQSYKEIINRKRNPFRIQS